MKGTQWHTPVQFGSNALKQRVLEVLCDLGTAIERTISTVLILYSNLQQDLACIVQGLLDTSSGLNVSLGKGNRTILKTEICRNVFAFWLLT